ncbi:NO-inducible flavohemoprotein [Paenibacillus sp. GYB003]|uniref:NO-inducible flavohemoprotein n=1 Tax=Paenibacillus sp. GYB003 TaxID=2994392 RepID=UPI002F963464
MLAPATIEIIKSTVPVLEKHGTAITKRFYELLFDNHPELLNVFNHANQKQGRQQAALAGAVYAAAQHIDNLEAILPVVRQIGHKHRSLGIKAEQYPIVGRNLLAAIQDVLGDAATEDVIRAWGEAYGVIADAFIGVEADMYEQAEKQEGGWAGFRAFRVERKVRESEEIASFYLVPADGKPIASYAPGQYVSVKAEIPGEPNVHIRQYSLSGAPGKPYYRISVKREDAAADRPAGKVSVYLHETVGEGDVLPLSAPAGSFTLDEGDRRPVVLISGGVGVTPLAAMLHALAERNDPNRPVAFIHAARNGDVHALRKEVEELASGRSAIRAYWCYEKPTERDRAAGAFHQEGYIDLNWLRRIVPTKDAGFYFCGPIPFMKAINRALLEWGVAPADIHYEFFGPSGRLDD